MTEAGIESQTNLGRSLDSVEQESRNEQDFYTLIARMRDVAHDERDKGGMFERLMCHVLAIASPYSERYTKVQLYKDWAAEHPECTPNARDIGIDLVATLIEPEWKGPNKEVLAIFLVLTARSSNAKALPSSAQFLRHRAAVHTAR